ncbi:MAG: hypothetical protein KVP17_000779 [Porospora cf. gigantea B]|uniref:uncharacterized protein n=1 Tax=Porospora cf. gigantea B TaxID=2853592 RepID=UPI003571DB2A|nr:MAG: hypothetical protein KVP17_000779 [Porospora cf. gigantea B]
MTQHFDFFVIGGGSGGIASARRAATYGAKVAVAECSRWGGTCVNVGCVPKKMMWWCSQVREFIEDSHHYGFEKVEPKFSWEHMKTRRDFTIKRLNGIYTSNLEGSKVTIFNEFASLVDSHLRGGPVKVKVGENIITADHVLIASGSAPNKLGVEGEELTINSDGFFALEKQPKKAAVIGAGYIAVELAGVLQSLGTETHLIVRGDTALRGFDDMLKSNLDASLRRSGIHMQPNNTIKSFERVGDTVTVNLNSGEALSGFDCVLVATGRHALIKNMNLGAMALKASGHIEVDDFQSTSVPGVFALGDVCGEVQLTPMAIAAGRRLADRLFGGIPNAKADYSNVPTVVFSHPTLGTIGLTEREARDKYGEDVVVYTSTSVNLYYSAFDQPPSEKPRTHMKLVCVKPAEKIVGLHVIGEGADEMLQGFGVAIKMGATKADFDSVVAIHPSASEEFVTMSPWGLCPN